MGIIFETKSLFEIICRTAIGSMCIFGHGISKNFLEFFVKAIHFVQIVSYPASDVPIGIYELTVLVQENFSGEGIAC